MASHTKILGGGDFVRDGRGWAQLFVKLSRVEQMLRSAISQLTLWGSKPERPLALSQIIPRTLVSENYMNASGSSGIDPQPPTLLHKPRCPGAGLQDSECFAIAACLRAIPGTWIIQWVEEEVRGPSMVIFSEESNNKPVVAISRSDLLCRVELETSSQTFDLGRYREFNAALRLVVIALGGDPEILLGSELYWAELADCALKAGCRQEAERLIAHCLYGA